MGKYINIDCVFRTDIEEWDIVVKDEVSNELEYTECNDSEFERVTRKLRQKYETKGYKVEVNIREG